MSDFTSDFWSWWITAIVVGGIAWCIWLLVANSKGKLPAGGTAEATGHVWDENLEELNNPLPRWWIIKFYITLVFGIAYLALYPGLGSFSGILGWTQVDQYDVDAWYDLAEVSGLAGDIVAVHRARAEFFALHGNYQKAIQHLRYARGLITPSRDKLLAQLDARITDFRDAILRRG